MAFTNPEANLAKLGLSEGACVADLGAGSGHYALAAARRVGEDGRVFAVEIQTALGARVKKEAQEQRLGNVEVFQGDISAAGGTKLRDNSVDVVILSNVLFQIEDKKGVAAEAKRIAKRGGRVFVIEWRESFGGLGPSPEDVVAEDTARRLFEDLGFSLVEAFPAGNYHYGLIYRK